MKITLTLNGARREVDLPPGMRLLDALRGPLELSGTKEGCGEGECGACAVLLDGEPVNACLVLAIQCEGRAVTTVEGLGSVDHLAPLQQCFVEHGGAQCGICTPGMLIAAEALLARRPSPSDHEIREALAGNICRCTGYQRIVESVRKAAELYAAGGTAMSVLDLVHFDVRRYRSLEALCDLVASRNERGDRTVLLAGGTDWVVEQEMSPPQPRSAKRPLVVDVSRMQELRGVRKEGDRVWIGAATTYLEIQRHVVVRERLPLVERMSHDVGAVTIQARGTLGGNLATGSPAADGVTALAALDATIVVASVRGTRRIPMSELQTGYKMSTRAPDEVFVGIEIHAPPVGSPWVWRKVGTRKAQAISKVALAGVAVVEQGRAVRFGLGMASAAPVTALLRKTRALALAKPLAEITDAEIDRAVDEDVSPIDDVRSTREYRAHCARVVVRGWFESLRG